MKYKLPRHIIYVLFFLLFFTEGKAQYASEHYIAPSPWQYWSDANEIVLTTESITTVTVTLSKSDGTFLTTRTLTSSSPDVYRFAGQPWNTPKNPVNSVLTNAGLIVTATGGKVSVNLRNVASDQASSTGGDTDGNTIKGNASLVSFGNEGRGTEFRLGYYRTDYSSGTFGSFPGVAARPVYSVMAVEDNTQVTLNGTNLVSLNKGQSYLFQPTTVGDLLQANKPVVANTGAYTDTPGGCGDGAVDQIAPVSILGKKHIVIRGSGSATTTNTKLPEQTTFVASKNNTTVTVRNYNNSGVLISTNNYILTNAGNYQSIFHGDGANAYSSSIIESNEPIIVYSGTAQGCEVDIATVLPVGGCSGSKWTSTSRFVRYEQTAPNAALPYFGFVLIESATTPILVNGTNIETTTGTSRFQIGNSGFYLTKFDNNQIGNPNYITVTSTARMNVGIVQQGGGFSMSGFFSSFNETPSLPDITYDSNGCAIDVITADAGLEPYQWYYEGSLLPGETSQSIVPALTGNYSITGTRDCGVTGQSAVVYVAVCGDLGVTKTVANGPLPNQVEFTITATNAGPNDDKNVVVTDVLPVGYTYVSSNPSTGTYSNTTGKWNIGNFANGGSATLTILATINASGTVNNTASIKGSNLDLNTVNNSSTTVPTGALRLLKTAQAGTYNSIGDIITYDLELTNTGRIPLYTITITDGNADSGSISPASVTNISPGASISITAKHTVTAADLLAGKVINSAKASGFDGSNNPISDISGTDPLNPSDDTPIETVTISIIDADDDTVSNVNGYVSNTNVINIFANDDLNGASFTAAEVNITISGTGVPAGLTLNNNGNVDVAAGTPAGTYTFDYTICEKAVNTNCSIATVTVTVIPAPIDAVNDTVFNVNGYTGATGVTNVLTNDKLNGVAVIPSQVTLTEGTGDTDELTININGSVDVTPGTPAGTYTLNYTICEVLNPANCDTAAVTVTVVPAPIDAVNDTVTNVNGYTGASNVINVLTNDSLNGVAVIPSEVTLTEGTGDTDELTINTDGTVDVVPGTPAGTYTLNYTNCEVLNATNCDTAAVTVTVVPAPIDAVNDTAGNVNGYTGASNVVNVLTNDTLNGVAVIPSEVTLTEGTGDTDELTINTDGTVDVAPGTPAGTYTLNYTICEVLNATNCDTAAVTVTVIPAVIDAVNDTAGNVNGYTGASNVVNVLTNDTLNGVAIIPSEVILTEGTGDTDELTINTNGTVDVAANTPAGTYTLNYTICEVLNPANCDTAAVTVTVIPAVIDTVIDTATNVNGYNGASNVVNVLTNDTLNGVAVISSEVTLTEGTGDTDELTINTNGTVDVAANTPAGTYTLNYTICEVLNPANCDTAAVTVTVIPAVIDAVNDTAANVNGYTGATGVTNVLTNDTLNGVAVVASQVTLTEGTGDTDELTINANGSVDVAANTPAGTYTLNYTICEVLNPANCNDATVTVTVVPAPIDAVNDTVNNVNGYIGVSNIVNVLTNDTLNGVAVIPSEVTLTEGTGDTDELTINTNGSVDVAPGTPAGTYTLGYTICEVLNPANCNDATVTVTVVPAPIDAVNDTATNVNGYTGASNVINVLTNDTLNGVAVIPSEVTLTEGTGDTDELTINTNGTVDVAANTPAGTYTLNYTICEVLNPANCNDATVTVTVVPAVIDAVNDTATNVNGYTGATGVTNVLTNDTLNGVAVIPSEVTLTEGTGDTDELTINTNGTVDVAANTPAGTYTLNYTICEVLNPANCDTAAVTVTVIPAVIDAVNDTVNNVNGYTGVSNVVNVLTNDTLNGVAVIPSQVTLTEGTGDTDELTINTNGSVDVAANTPAGTYTLNYTICEVLNPANCDTAAVTVTVIPAVIDAVNDTAANVNGYTGATGVTNVLTNDTLNGVAVVTSQVTLTEGTGDTDELTINTNGTVDVAANTPAGTYTLNYTICEVLNPANCDTATVTVTVVPAPIDAVNDTAANVNGYTGATGVTNVLTNDTLNGVAVVASHVTLTEGTGDTDELTINTNGTVDVAPDTAAGTYTLNYTICEVLNPANCDTAAVTVTVIPAVIDAVNDTVTNINGPTGEIDVINVLTNDTLNGVPVIPSEVTITTVTGNPQLILDPVDGSVDVVPNTPGGTYELTYQICEILNPTNCETATVTIFVMEPKFVLTKDAQAGTYDSPGDVITYNLVLTNTGNIAIDNITITDENADNINPATVAALAPGETVNIMATHIITQSDLDSGFVHNNASVTGTDPEGGSVMDNSIDPTQPLQPGDPGYDPTCAECTVTEVTQLPSLLLTKDAQAADYDSVGDIITYDIILKNTGNVTITNLIVSDANADAVTPPTVAILLPGASVNITATHSITQADLDVGFVYNSAQVTGSDPAGNTIAEESSDPTDPAQPGDAGYNPVCPECTISQINQLNALQLLKEAAYQDANGDGKVNPGDTIFYSFTVENKGNTTLTDIVVQDPLVTVNGGPLATLAPGGTDTVTFTALYTITQGDMEKGAIYNLALADGLDPKGNTVITESKDPTPISENDPLFDASCPDCTVISLTQTPSMALVKTAVFNDDNNDGSAQAGETISYSFKVVNTGTVALHNVVVTDALPGVVLSGGPIVVLEVGEEDTTTYTAIYTITQADINAGMVINQAGAQAETATGNKLAVTSDDNDVLGNDPTMTELNGCAIEIFNAISADGNGDNDEFYIGGIECYPDNEVHIFNRWGVLVYDVKGYDNKEKAFRGYSDGRVTVSNSSSLPAGTYFYVIQYKKADGSTHKKDGYLYITR